ncbi:MAG TPA: hypothetical protein VM097_03120 [Mycobacteriales bacterium]|nr:hypothetical protein [Mycobacteriales bacterium]
MTMTAPPPSEDQAPAADSSDLVWRVIPSSEARERDHRSSWSVVDKADKRAAKGGWLSTAFSD